ncbi:hypothetical protein [Okeania sp. KiyG1]|uniref:hypothetical protein n=1 Tax=Okeania sp. KiyG1 TaxID=2720165 RepID=UPI0019B61173|nr:hypothetical protein [Okeania sp. KiyG1]GGA47337.1 hypothetical protein CYANOKiyG1_66460 [Okeania sp. KiyG1]
MLIAHASSVSDDDGLIEMLSENIDYFKSKPVNVPKITILLDNGYQERKNHTEVKKNLSCDYDQNSVETITKTIIGGEKTGRKNRVCSRKSQVGH